MPPGLRTPAIVSPGLIDYEQECSVLPEKHLRTIVQIGLFPLRGAAAVYWLTVGWYLHRPSREERKALEIARRAAATAGQSQPTATALR